MAETEAPSPAIFIHDEWSEAADTIAYCSVASSPPVALICGAKNCGKTTLSRHLLNVLLQRYKRVAYLDTDVGQPEFTPPGFLSLTIVDKLTPDLTIPCLKTPERCFFFGDISAKRDPAAYLKCIFALSDYLREEHQGLNRGEDPAVVGLPLVINTPGWVKGVGYDVLVKTLKYIAPTHVVKINISVESKNLPPGYFWLDEDCDETVHLIEIKSARQDSFNRSVLTQKDARLLRDMRITAYFRQCFPSSSNITKIKELAHALASHPPYEVPVSAIKIKHLHCQVPSTEVFYSLNASIIGLAISSNKPDDVPSCVGLGIVRGIDLLKGSIYVITPVPLKMLVKVDLFLQGFIQIPTSLLQAQGCVSPYMSTDVLTTS
ncbi:polynucleotide 5'-hydroxyl-kinase NOL9 [Rhodamnia argentea]|uniref:Polynucleotide 5'-hydroxyl-kinase NOL9 n=1 Tax=Rhodamnia argentea TaxID=178133 RepID=A0A8B8P925_9MYRT|nr:polynucleotide 5'-hydroxyl-kinase NOL9 [Rhodamnia argentea]